MNLTLFSSKSCAPCRQLKQYLAMKRIQYTERIVDDEPNSRDELIALVGYSIFPTLTYEVDGELKYIAGYNIGKVREALGI